MRQESQLVPADFLDPTFCPLSRRAWEEIKHKVKKKLKKDKSTRLRHKWKEEKSPK